MHDVLIIGAGPAGISAALWCDELGLDTLMLEQSAGPGGQLLSVHNPIENYPGLRARNGREFLECFSERVSDADFDLWTDVDIESVDLKAKRVVLQSGEELPGETEFAGRGMIESSSRDRETFAGKDVVVIGGGDAAAENALLLAEVCPTVTLVHRSKKLKARPTFINQLQGQHSITVFAEAVVTRILGDDAVEAVEILRKDSLKPFQMAVKGVAVRVGVQPNTELFRGQLQLDEEGYALVTSLQETSVTNVFAIGDVSNPLAPTISGASGAGATAAKVISERLNRRAV
jgi:thioredoxin reductase (NADPH)